MDKKIIMIHQPDFMPWIGFFHKFTMVDEFVLLDHVTNHPKSRNWLRRVKIIVNGNEHWLSMPLKKNPKKSFIPIYDLEINKEDVHFKSKLLPAIQNTYKKSPFYNEIIPLLEEHFSDSEGNMKKWNMSFIYKISERLKIKVPKISETSSMTFENSKTEMLIDICNKVKATHWLHTGGVEGYLEPELFEKNNLGLVKHEFTHPIYKQFNSREFKPGLSIIDVLFNVGYEKTRALILNA